MSDYKTIQEFLEDHLLHQDKVLIPKLRWLQVKELRKKYPNDQDFGHEVAKLIMKDE